MYGGRTIHMRYFVSHRSVIKEDLDQYLPKAFYGRSNLNLLTTSGCHGGITGHSGTSI